MLDEETKKIEFEIDKAQQVNVPSATSVNVLDMADEWFK